MAIQIQLRQGTTTEHNTFTGAVGELTYDTEKKQLRVHDGSTVGGKVVDDTTRDVTSQVSNATETTAGKAKIATTTIALAGVNDADIMTPLKTLGLFNLKSLGVDQSPQSFTVSSRVGGTSYLNSTGKPITVYLTGAGSEKALQISKDGTTWFTAGMLGKQSVITSSACAVVPTGFYYKLASGAYDTWTEVR